MGLNVCKLTYFRRSFFTSTTNARFQSYCCRAFYRVEKHTICIFSVPNIYYHELNILTER